MVVLFLGKIHKVDRSAAYASRYLAKNIVAAGLASRCTIQIAYAIGVAEPVSLYANLHGTGKVDDVQLQEVLRDCMDLTPRGIRQHLGMNAPIYSPLLLMAILAGLLVKLDQAALAGRQPILLTR